MPKKDQKFGDLIASAGASEVKKPGVEALPDEATREGVSEAELAAEATATIEQIDGATKDAIGEIGAGGENRDLVSQAEAGAEASKAAVTAVVETPATPLEIIPEYKKAKTWEEFVDIVTKGVADAELVRERIEAYLRGEIAIKKVPLNDDQKKVLAGFASDFKEGPTNFEHEASIAQAEAEIKNGEAYAGEEAFEKFKEKNPEILAFIEKLIDPDLSNEDLSILIQKFNEAEWGQIKKAGSYQAMSWNIDGKPGRIITFKWFKNGRMTMSASFGKEEKVVSEDIPATPTEIEKEKATSEKPVAEETAEPKAPAEVSEPAVAESKELSSDLEAARLQYIEALRQRKSSFSGKRKVGIGKLKAKAEEEFQAIVTNYHRLQKEAFFQQLAEAGVETGKITPEITDQYLEFLKQEEQAIDNLATASDRSRLQKFQEWWKRNWKLRLVAGTAMMGVGGALVATGAGAGVGAGLFGVARGLMSGTGTYMSSEAWLDRRTEGLGQKGLIDKVAGTGFTSKAEGKKIIAEAIENKFFEAYTIDELRQEIARLRVMSLDKGVTIENAGRFGADQAPLIKNLLQTYYKKLREETIIAGQDKIVKSKELDDKGKEKPGHIELGQTLSTQFDKNIEANENTVVSELDKQRIKFMRRQTVAAALGISVGAVVGLKAWEKVEHSSGHTSYEDIKKLFPEEAGQADTTGIEDPFKAVVASQTETPSFNNVLEVHKGDTVWSLAKEQLHQRLGAQFDSLDEARKTYLIDGIKDKIAANPSAFGLRDIDQLQVGDKIDFTEAFKDPELLKELQAHAAQLDQADLQNIISNNEALKEAASHGVRITSENVDQVAATIREHGIDALNPDGSLRVAAKAAKETVQASMENSPVNSEMGEAVELSKQTADSFIESPNAQYNSDIFAAAKSAGSLDAVFNKLVDNGNTEQIEGFINDWAQAEGLSDNKREIFLGSLMHNDNLELGLNGQIEAGDGVKILQENLKAFDATVLDANAHTTEEALKAFEDLPKDEWSAVKVGDRYALVRKVVDHKLFWHKLRWLVSFNADHNAEMTISDKDSLENILANKTFGSSVVSNVKKVVSAKFDNHPPAMS